VVQVVEPMYRFFFTSGSSCFTTVRNRYTTIVCCASGGKCHNSTRQCDGQAASLLYAATATLGVLVGTSSSVTSDCSTDQEVQLTRRKFDAARWAATLAQIKDGIVALKVNSVRAFDTHPAGAGQATGFVVDAQQGLILTNRHVVTEGPVIAEALFDNHSEVQLHAVYRDPVHDFGLFQYNPGMLNDPGNVPELKLRPDKAAQGLDVRVIGNNAGEKLSVLGAMLARLDREAPFYGNGTYNDFNTFYFQAASATSGGSSGSPVVDSDGDVIALNAAGKSGTSASFYLPLDCVKRAVDLVRQGLPVPRGTLQVTFTFTPFSELVRLGLSQQHAAAARASGEDSGMLVVQSIVPGGPASAFLQPGDILLSIDGKAVTRFVPLESILDDSVGRSLEVCVERGGRFLSQHLCVQDLHAITPHEYLECGDAVFNNLSYQQARTHNLPVEGVGVYVASQGYMLRRAGICAGSLIVQVGQQRTRNVAELEAALAVHSDGSPVPVYFMNVTNPAHRSVTMIRIDRTWFPMQRTCRDDPKLGVWTARPSPLPLHSTSSAGSSNDQLGSKIRWAPGTNPVEDKLVRSLAKVTVSVPLAIDGMPSTEYIGTGMVVDAKRGLVVCDRNTAPGALCDCLLTFGSSCTIPAHVVYIHPLHNLAVLKYDVSLVDDTVTPVTLRRSTSHELKGKKLWHVTSVGSVRTGCELVSDQASATESEPCVAPLSHPPRWQETNIDLLGLKGGAAMASSQDGVIANDDGEVVAYWASFLTQIVKDGRLQDGHYFAGITTDLIEDMLDSLSLGAPPPELHTIGAEMEKLGLSAVRGMLMDSTMTEQVEAKCEHWPPQVMSIRRRWASTDAHDYLRDSDIALEIEGRHIETFRDIELAVRGRENVRMLIVREGQQLEVELRTQALQDGVTERVMLWCGAVLQTAPTAVAAQRGQERCGVYVSSRFHGSPAAKHGLPPMARIIEVDGESISDLDEFLQIVAAKSHGEDVRLKHLDLRGAQSMTCLRVDTKFWPTAVLQRIPGPRSPGGVEPFHWQRTTATGSGATQSV